MKVAVIEVKRTGEGDPLEFAVIVRVGDGETRHHVTMVRDTCERLTAGTHTPERCIEAACEFLLDREPKESTPAIVGGSLRNLTPCLPGKATAHNSQPDHGNCKNLRCCAHRHSLRVR